jgi:hypothetical protein
MHDKKFIQYQGRKAFMLTALAQLTPEKKQELFCLCDISGSQCGESEDDCLLGCYIVCSGRCLPTFQTCLLPPSSYAQRPDNKGSKHV